MAYKRRDVNEESWFSF